MKIVILVHNLIGGGAERVAALWATGFIERGYEVTVITNNSKNEQRYEMSSKVNVKNIGSTIPIKVLRLVLSHLGITRKVFLIKLSKLLHTICPDVCIGVMGEYARDAYSVTRDIKTIVVQTYHGAFELPDSAPEIRKKDIEKCFEFDSMIQYRTVLTYADKDFIGDRMYNVFVMPNPLAFAPLLTLPEKKKYVLACGRLDVWDVKGFDLLIKAWSMISRKHPEWRLRIAGGGSEKSKEVLLQMAQENDIIDQFDLLGFRNDVVDLYKESEIFVLSSRYEGFGMVLIEAMSQGCACVACDYKGRQKEILKDSTIGLTCNTDNAQSLARAIDKMISDGEYRKECQKNSIKRASYYSINNTIDRWDSIFDSIGVI